MHGDTDDTVYPANALQMVDAIGKAKRSFDLLIVPDMDHGTMQDPYVIRIGWDSWATHLLGKEPPGTIGSAGPSD